MKNWLNIWRTEQKFKKIQNLWPQYRMVVIFIYDWNHNILYSCRSLKKFLKILFESSGINSSFFSTTTQSIILTIYLKFNDSIFKNSILKIGYCVTIIKNWTTQRGAEFEPKPTPVKAPVGVFTYEFFLPERSRKKIFQCAKSRFAHQWRKRILTRRTVKENRILRTSGKKKK